MVRWEDKIKAFLVVIGKIEEEFKTAQDNFENAQRIKKEREFQAATKDATCCEGGGSSSKDTTTPRRHGTVRKELKPTNNLNSDMTSQEMRIFFKDYEHYRAASELGLEPQERQLAYLHLCLEPDVRA